MLANYPVSAMLRAADINRARDFYTGKLGLPLMMEDEGVFMVAAGQGTSIAVYERPGPAPENNETDLTPSAGTRNLPWSR